MKLWFDTPEKLSEASFVHPGVVFAAQLQKCFIASQVSVGLMYADLGPHVQAPVQPPSTGNDVQYSLLLHNQGEQVALDPAGVTSLEQHLSLA